jgi:hypothetical protein
MIELKGWSCPASLGDKRNDIFLFSLPIGFGCLSVADKTVPGK